MSIKIQTNKVENEDYYLLAQTLYSENNGIDDVCEITIEKSNPARLNICTGDESFSVDFEECGEFIEVLKEARKVLINV